MAASTKGATGKSLMGGSADVHFDSLEADDYDWVFVIASNEERIDGVGYQGYDQIGLPIY